MTDLNKNNYIKKTGKSGYIISLYRKPFISPNWLIYWAFSHSVSYLVSYLVSHSSFFISELFIVIYES